MNTTNEQLKDNCLVKLSEFFNIENNIAELTAKKITEEIYEKAQRVNKVHRDSLKTAETLKAFKKQKAYMEKIYGIVKNGNCFEVLENEAFQQESFYVTQSQITIGKNSLKGMIYFKTPITPKRLSITEKEALLHSIKG